MFTSSTKLLRDYYAAFNAADWDGMLSLLTEDVTHDINQGSRETGREAFAAFIARMNRCYSEQLSDIVLMVSPDGSRAAAEYVVAGRYLKTGEGLPQAQGQLYLLPGGAFFDIRDGRIARISNYYNLRDWLAQVSA